MRKSIYTEELACQYRVPLVRLHEGAGGSITGAAGNWVGEGALEKMSEQRFRLILQLVLTLLCFNLLWTAGAVRCVRSYRRGRSQSFAQCNSDAQFLQILLENQIEWDMLFILQKQATLLN